MNRTLLFLFFTSLVFSQNNLEKRNLKGKVKSIKYSFEIITENIEDYDSSIIMQKLNPFYNTRNASMLLFEDKDTESYNSFEEYDPNGILIKYNPANDLENPESIKNSPIELVYKEQQSEIETINFPQYPTYLSFIPIQKPFPFLIKEREKIYDFNPNFTNFSIENGKIEAIKQYDTIKTFDAKIIEMNSKSIDFIYDLQGRIVRKEIVFKDASESFDESYTLEVYNYLYDDKNRIKRFQLFINKKFYLQEIYNFDESGDLNSIEKHQKTYSNETGNLFSSKAVFSFDFNKNINKVDFYDNDFGIQLLNTFQFEYEYDNQKNWIIVKMLLNNKPVVLFTRAIVYRE